LVRFAQHAQHFLRMHSVFKAMAYFPLIVKALRRYVEGVQHLSFSGFREFQAVRPFV
jgi:hypothetical protein